MTGHVFARGERVRFMEGEPRRFRWQVEHRRGFGRRAARGDIRAAILALLAEEPMHGYQIIQELGERTGGAWRPSPGSVYPTLQQLEDEELVRVTGPAAGRRVYELTDAGRAEVPEGEAPWEAVAAGDEGRAVLRDLVHQVGAASRQVAHAGSPAQIEAAQAVLQDARRSLYRLLAD